MSSELLLVLLQEHSPLGPSEQRGHQLGAAKGDTIGVAALRHIQKGRQHGSKASGPDVTTKALAQGDPGVWPPGQPSHSPAGGARWGQTECSGCLGNLAHSRFYLPSCR